MIESWIDELAKVWEFQAGLGMVRSYRLIEKAEFPSSIDPADLERSPVALTIPAAMRPQYSEGGPLIGFYRGVTEFHVAPDVNKSRLPALLPWYGKILRAAASHMKLNNTVEYFAIDDQEDAIAGPLDMQYGGEAPHWGFLVNWIVKERLENQLTVSR